MPELILWLLLLHFLFFIIFFFFLFLVLLFLFLYLYMYLYLLLGASMQTSTDSPKAGPKKRSLTCASHLLEEKIMERLEPALRHYQAQQSLVSVVWVSSSWFVIFDDFARISLRQPRITATCLWGVCFFSPSWTCFWFQVTRACTASWPHVWIIPPLRMKYSSPFVHPPQHYPSLRRSSAEEYLLPATGDVAVVRSTRMQEVRDWRTDDLGESCEAPGWMMSKAIPKVE